MSCARTVTRFHIKSAVFLHRLLGGLQSGNLKKNKSNSELLKAKMLTDFFARKYLAATENLEQEVITVERPEMIWQFWDNPLGRTTPGIVTSSLESVSKFKGNFEHKILDISTFEQYSDLPGFVLDKFKKGQISYIHFSDLLRLNLLKNHGGVWMDATAYMTDAVPKFILEEEFFVFLTGKLSRFPYSYMQNCFIRAKKGSFLCEAWYRMCIQYWKDETEVLDYFQHQLMFKALVGNQAIAKNLFSQMPQISEDGIHQLVGDNLLKKFDPIEWERIRKASFFQKTTYKVPQGVDYSGTYFSMLTNDKV